MKNKIKKILLLGMTAMFTAGAAGTAVISCPVWADEAEQNSETAEEPKAEDAAVEEEIADQTDDKTENTDLKTVEHPRMSVYSIRRFSIVRVAKKYFRSNRNRQIIRWILIIGRLRIRMMKSQQ